LSIAPYSPSPSFMMWRLCRRCSKWECSNRIWAPIMTIFPSSLFPLPSSLSPLPSPLSRTTLRFH